MPFYEHLHDAQVHPQHPSDYNQPLYGQGLVRHPPNDPLQPYGDGAVGMPFYEHLHDAQVHPQHPSDYNQPLYGQGLVRHPPNDPLRPYEDGAVGMPFYEHLHDAQVHPQHPSDYNQPLYGQGLVRHPPNDPLQPYGDGAVGMPFYEHLHDAQVHPQHPSDYNQPLYGQGLVRHPPNDPLQPYGDGAVGLPHDDQFYQSGGHQFQQSGYDNPSYDYNEADQPSNEPMHGAAPSHLPDQVQGYDLWYFPRTLPSEESKWLQNFRKEIEKAPEYELFKAYDPVRMSDFLGLDAGHNAGKLTKKVLKQQLKKQFQGWAQTYINSLFSPYYVQSLRKMSDNYEAYLASPEQRTIIFNIIMQRLLLQKIDIALTDQVLVLEKWNLKEEGGIEKVKERFRNIFARHGKALQIPLPYTWESQPEKKIFDLGGYRIFVIQMRLVWGKYYRYRIFALYRENPTSMRLFLGDFVASNDAHRYITSTTTRL
ncbi:hypothetical protein ACQY0O_004604 [Thecaphora frezii]